MKPPLPDDDRRDRETAAPGVLRGRVVLLVLLLLTTIVPGAAVSREPETGTAGGGEVLALSADLRIRVVGGRDIELECRPRPGEGYPEISLRLTGSARRARSIEDWNGKTPPTPDRFVRVPLGLLDDNYRGLVLLRLFPADRRQNGDWIHVARAGLLPTYDEGLWQVASWFSGDGSSYSEIARACGLRSPELSAGQEVRIPGRLLHRCLAEKPSSDDGSLVYGEDDEGRYAAYRMKPGEALYSAVIVRFTGRTDPDDVNDLAEQLARRSGVRDVHDIPFGFQIRIPMEVLEPEFLPADHPRRREADSARAALERELDAHPVAPAKAGLDGVLVIVDPGHGGRDSGTINHGIREHDYVADVACRLKRLVEDETSARVFLTIEDPGGGCAPSSGDRAPERREDRIRTDPPFTVGEQGESSMAVNLRWYLANSVLDKAVRAGIDPDRVVFLSLHADSRHPSLRGLMVYVPGVRFRTGVQGNRSAAYLRFGEVREKPTRRFSRQALVRSEAVSRRLAACVVDAFRRESLPVQPFSPVRDRVIRGRETWLPAVLRGNAVPAKVLAEMVNLSNPQDAAMLGSADQRARLARALERSLFAYFGETQSARRASGGSDP